MGVIEQLYKAVNNGAVGENPLEPSGAFKHLDDFCNNFIDTGKTNPCKFEDVEQEGYDALCDLVGEFNKNAFMVGFRTAIELIFAGRNDLVTKTINEICASDKETESKK